ncbi:hypothetical protein DPMN_031580 [Dreissena polymorpha]|uniref:Uncharacterized protein n=1 Tax=Dreissena polymorpha TaxID=45954 RepID=A0A9D4M1B2_DREPO|nr:hypothetical protein DPMN_031580 [Dreissena polymorpha]
MGAGAQETPPLRTSSNKELCIMCNICIVDAKSSKAYRKMVQFDKRSKKKNKPAKCIKKKSGHAALAVRTLDFQRTFQDICETNKDDWAAAFRSRLQIVSDLPAAAADAVYRQMCNINFRTNKAIPVYFQQEHLEKSKTSSGRPRDADAGDA